jgi:hypothetical protein
MKLAILHEREIGALRMAARYQPVRKLHRLEARLKLTFDTGQEQNVRRWPPRDIENAVIDAMGGSALEP